MKKVIILGLVFLTSLTFAQSDSTKSKITGYAVLGLSTSTGNDFALGSYPSLEVGLMRNNIALGIIFGRGNFVGIGKSDDIIRNYYYEVKTTACYPVGAVTGSVIFGWGQYIDTKNSFIEYGVGITYNRGRMGYGVTYSNWDGGNYLTPAITLNF